MEEIYMVNTYEEHGPEEIRAFFSRADAREFLLNEHNMNGTNHIAEVQAALEKADKNKNVAVDVLYGWGGWQVTRLDVGEQHG